MKKSRTPSAPGESKVRLPLEDQLASAILGIGRIEEHLGPRGPYFTVGSHTIVYTAAPRLIETWLPPSVVEELRSELAHLPNVIPRRKGSRWVGVRLNDGADIDLVVSLARRAAEAVRNLE